MIIKSLTRAAYIVLAIAATNAQAIPMLETDRGGIILGVSGLTVDGIMYDAAFNDVSYDDLLAISPPSPIYGSQFSEQATTALWEFFRSFPTGYFSPDWFYGCTDTTIWNFSSCTFLTANKIGVIPPDVSGAGKTTASGYVFELLSNGVLLQIYPNNTIPTYENPPFLTPVTWRESPVPEPPVVLLMASGIIIFLVTRRKHRTQ